MQNAYKKGIYDMVQLNELRYVRLYVCVSTWSSYGYSTYCSTLVEVDVAMLVKSSGWVHRHT